MADYYTQFSFIISLPEPALAYFSALTKAHGELADLDLDGLEEQEVSTLHRELLADGILDQADLEFIKVLAKENCGSVGVSVSPDDGGLWLRGDEGPNIELLAMLIQRAIKCRAPSATVGFEWANTCSKLRLDAFSGGAAYITDSEIRWCSTGDWLTAQRSKA